MSGQQPDLAIPIPQQPGCKKHRELYKKLRFGLSHSSICLETSPESTRLLVTRAVSLLLSALAVIWPAEAAGTGEQSSTFGAAVLHRSAVSSRVANTVCDWFGLLPTLLLRPLLGPLLDPTVNTGITGRSQVCWRGGGGGCKPQETAFPPAWALCAGHCLLLVSLLKPCFLG